MTLGLLRVFQRRGLKVQMFKCGADGVDSRFHSFVCPESGTVHLDTFLASRTHVQQVYNRYGAEADVCMIDGMTGLADGYNRLSGSTAEVAQALGLPAVLVVNARGMAYSVAPMLYGFKAFRSLPRIAGVLFNQVSSPAHYACLQEACASAGLPCLGYVPPVAVQLPQRYGPLLSGEPVVKEVADSMAAAIEAHVDVNKLLALCNLPFPCSYTLPYTSTDTWRSPLSKKWKIAVCMDSAYLFFLRENMDRLKELGMVSQFSLLHSHQFPEADLVYLPGGYPELFVRMLHRRSGMLQQLHDYIEAGGRVLAEDGGLAILGRSLKLRDNKAYAMAGVLPLDFETISRDARVNAGYRMVRHGDTLLKGYEMHYTQCAQQGIASATQVFNAKGMPLPTLFIRYKNLVASFIRWYWGDTDLRMLWDFPLQEGGKQ